MELHNFLWISLFRGGIPWHWVGWIPWHWVDFPPIASGFFFALSGFPRLPSITYSDQNISELISLVIILVWSVIFPTEIVLPVMNQYGKVTRYHSTLNSCKTEGKSKDICKKMPIKWGCWNIVIDIFRKELRFVCTVLLLVCIVSNQIVLRVLPWKWVDP